MIRYAQFAGSWYPKDPRTLRQLVEKAVSDVREKADFQAGPCRFAVLPHAGLFYSKDGIAPFFAADLGRVERVLILSPSHYANLNEDQLVSCPLSACQTPLGTLEAFSLPDAQDRYGSAIQAEHALEMVLPFLAALEHPPQVGMALISHFSDPHVVEAMSATLIDQLGRRELEAGATAVIASSDFTHYGPRFGYTPYQNKAQHKVKEDDLTLSHLLCEGRVTDAFAFCRAHRSTVCGYAPAMLVSLMAKQMNSIGWVADYYTSCDVSASDDADFVAYSTILWR